MSVVTELIAKEDNGGLCFGNYELAAKAKLDNFEVSGDLYKVKTYCDITKLEKNGMFVYESVPGTSVHQFMVSEQGVSFQVEAENDCQITLGLEENQTYDVTINGVFMGPIHTNMSGKLSISLEVEPGVPQELEIYK